MAAYSERCHEQEQNAWEAFSRFFMRIAASDGEVAGSKPHMTILNRKKR